MKRFLGMILAMSLSALAQEPSALIKDQRAIDLARQVLSAAGTPISPQTSTFATGVIHFVQGSADYPIRIYTLGNDRVRTEIDFTNGTAVKILNKGQGTFQPASGKLIRLNALNTLAERVMYIPTLSLLAEYDASYVQVEFVEESSSTDHGLDKIAVSWSEAGNDADQKEFLKRSRSIVSATRTTGEAMRRVAKRRG